jgi:hypothetical protein
MLPNTVPLLIMRARRELWGKGEEGEKSFTPYGNPLTLIKSVLSI